MDDETYENEQRISPTCTYYFYGGLLLRRSAIARSGMPTAMLAAPSESPYAATTWRPRAALTVSAMKRCASASAKCSLRAAGHFAAAGPGFTHDFSAPSAGPPPWYVYE